MSLRVIRAPKFDPPALGSLVKQVWADAAEMFNVNVRASQVIPNHNHGVVGMRDDDRTMQRSVQALKRLNDPTRSTQGGVRK